MGFFDIIGKDIKKKLNINLLDIGGIGKTVKLDISKKLSNNDNILKGFDKDILKGLGNKTNLNDDILKNIEKILPANIAFDGLKKPLKDIIKWFMDLTKSGAMDKFESIMDIFKDRTKELSGFKIKTESPIKFDAYMETVNEIWSFLFGIKPYALFLSDGDWVDSTKEGLYYTIVRTGVFMLISFLTGFSQMNQFFSAAAEQKIIEYYEFSRLDLFQYIDLYRRKILDIDQLYNVANKIGYGSTTVESALNSTEFYPTPRDLIEFSVKEAFEPDEKLFIHGGNAIPEAFKELAPTVGLPDEWIKKFWHSHWRLLSVGQILDAFHRKLVSESELLDYLRRLDYTENDQKLIRDMSFSLLTRVDVRRIYENGLMSTSELFDYYKTLGFSVNDAVSMTLLAKQVRFIETTDLRKLYIEQYEGGFLTESAIISLLRSTGLDSDEISQYLSFSDMQKDLDFKLELKKQIELRFYEGIIDFDELIRELRDLGVSNREIKRIQSNAVLFNYRKPKLPTMAELKRYLKKEIIQIQQFIYYALRLGLSIEHIEWILRDMEWLK